MSSSSSEPRGRVLAKYSTPLFGRVKKPVFSTTTSEIETNLSSENHRRINGPSIIKRKRLTKRRSKIKASLNVNLVKSTLRRDSDSDWNTQSERSVRQTDEFHSEVAREVPSQHSGYLPQCLETTRRDATLFRERSIDSDYTPFRSLTATNPVLEEKTVQEESEFLTLINIPSVIERAAEDSDEETELFPKRYKEPAIRTYPAPIKTRKGLFIDLENFDFTPKIAGSENATFRFDTTTSDILWDEFVRKNKDTVSGKYLDAMAKRLRDKEPKFFKSRKLATEVRKEAEAREKRQRQSHAKNKKGQKRSNKRIGDGLSDYTVREDGPSVPKKKRITGLENLSPNIRIYSFHSPEL